MRKDFRDSADHGALVVFSLHLVKSEHTAVTQLVINWEWNLMMELRMMLWVTMAPYKLACLSSWPLWRSFVRRAGLSPSKTRTPWSARDPTAPPSPAEWRTACGHHRVCAGERSSLITDLGSVLAPVRQECSYNDHVLDSYSLCKARTRLHVWACVDKSSLVVN